MSRIAVAAGLSYGLAWWKRLQDEGHSVLVWNKDKNNKRVGEGIIPLAGTFDELYWFAKEGALRREPVLVFFDTTGMGDDSERVRRYGIPVIGGCRFADRLERDREFGFRIADEAGCQLPPYEQYTTLTESAKASPNGEFFFKSDRFLSSNATKCLQDKEHQVEYYEELRGQYGDNIKHILQEKIEGVALSTGRWWNGYNWTGPYQASYEHKAFMNDDIGMSTGCSFNAMFFHGNDPQIAEHLGWDNLTMAFRQHQAAPGLYDINAVVDEEGQAYFLEWTPRLGYDSEPTSHRLFPSLGDHLFSLAEGREMPLPSGDIVYSTRLSVPPYPWEYSKMDDKSAAVGTRVRNIDGLWEGNFVAYQLRDDKDDGLIVASPEGIVGLSMAKGKKLSKVCEEATDYAKELGKRGIDGLQFRTDGFKCISEDAKKVKESGHEVLPGMLE